MLRVLRSTTLKLLEILVILEPRGNQALKPGPLMAVNPESRHVILASGRTSHPIHIISSSSNRHNIPVIRVALQASTAALKTPPIAGSATTITTTTLTAMGVPTTSPAGVAVRMGAGQM